MTPTDHSDPRSEARVASLPAKAAEGEPAWRVDSHVHLWDAVLDPEALRVMPASLHGAFTLATLERELDASRTAGAILIEAGSAARDLARLRADAAASDRVLGFIAYAGFGSPSIDPLLDSLKDDPKFLGVRVRLEGVAARALDEAQLLAVARSVVDRDLVLELLVEVDHLPAVCRLAGRLPDLRGIVDHLAKPDFRHGSDRAAWSSAIRTLSRETGLAMKLSVSPRAADLLWLADRGAGWSAQEVGPYVSEALEAFGPDRVAWGSDWPVGALGRDHGATADVVSDAVGHVGPDAASRIFAGTARRIYRLPS